MIMLRRGITKVINSRSHRIRFRWLLAILARRAGIGCHNQLAEQGNLCANRTAGPMPPRLWRLLSV